MNIGTTSGC